MRARADSLLGRFPGAPLGRSVADRVGNFVRVLGDVVDVFGNLMRHLPNVVDRRRGRRARLVHRVLVLSVLSVDLLGGRLRARVMLAADDITCSVNGLAPDAPAAFGVTVMVPPEPLRATQQRDIHEWPADG
jgi:hypothetical protein